MIKEERSYIPTLASACVFVYHFLFLPVIGGSCPSLDTSPSAQAMKLLHSAAQGYFSDNWLPRTHCAFRFSAMNHWSKWPNILWFLIKENRNVRASFNPTLSPTTTGTFHLKKKKVACNLCVYVFLRHILIYSIGLFYHLKKSINEKHIFFLYHDFCQR